MQKQTNFTEPDNVYANDKLVLAENPVSYVTFSKSGVANRYIMLGKWYVLLKILLNSLHKNHFLKWFNVFYK